MQAAAAAAAAAANSGRPSTQATPTSAVASAANGPMDNGSAAQADQHSARNPPQGKYANSTWKISNTRDSK